MRLWQRSSTTILPLILLGAVAVLLSCSPAETGPRAWIDWPLKGFETSPGTTLTVVAHAYAEDGVAEVQLAINRQPYRVVTPDQAGQQFVEISSDWLADEPGTYLLSVTAFDVNGQASNAASVSVTVTGESEGPGLTPMPSPVTTPLTTTLESPTVAPTTGTPEVAPLATATSPPPPTGTPVPPTATPCHRGSSRSR